jgi:hypothetical protein
VPKSRVIRDLSNFQPVKSKPFADIFFFLGTFSLIKNNKNLVFVTPTNVTFPTTTTTNNNPDVVLDYHTSMIASTTTTAKPLATTVASSLAPFGGGDHHQHHYANSRQPTTTTRHQWTHSPIVMAMITNNRMTNCRDVTKMMQECLASGSDDRVCQTAANYYDMCINNNGGAA